VRRYCLTQEAQRAHVKLLIQRHLHLPAAIAELARWPRLPGTRPLTRAGVAVSLH
jgi:hypothetical protein